MTQFFRDPEAFEALQTTMSILQLLRTKDTDDQVRVWVPGCATGEEVYSIAILLERGHGNGMTIADVQIFGTDIDDECRGRRSRGPLYRRKPPVFRPSVSSWFVDGR